MHVVRALFPYDSDNTDVVCVLCQNDGDNTHAVCALMAELKKDSWVFRLIIENTMIMKTDVIYKTGFFTYCIMLIYNTLCLLCGNLERTTLVEYTVNHMVV